MREIDLSVEVTGTPEEVFRAIATGDGVTAWLQPTEIEERPGGRYAYELDGRRNDTGHVSAYEPPHRFATAGVVWTPGGGGEPAELATEWTVTARDGGTCVVRMVMSGFGTGAAWDDEVEGVTGGMRAALESLRRHLAPGPTRVLAAVGVADREKAMPFYAALLGRAADRVPMPSDAEWDLGDTTLQLVEAPDRSGASMATFLTADLERWLAALRAAGLPVGAVRSTSVGSIAQVEDPDGNLLTLVQPAK